LKSFLEKINLTKQLLIKLDLKIEGGKNMFPKMTKIKVVVLIVFILGAIFLFPAGAIDFQLQKNTLNVLMRDDIDGIERDEIFENYSPFWLDRTYVLEPYVLPISYNDNDDAGHKRDAGNEISKSLPVYPGEMIDDWPGRGRTGKLSSSDDEDWYFFSVCKGQDIVITMTPPVGHNYDLGLWDDDKNERATSSNPGSTTEYITYTADYTDMWYMRINYISGSGEGRYSFDVTLDGQNDAGTGNDAGDGFALATTISSGNYEGYLDMNDEEDWYKFNVNTGENIRFVLKMKSSAHLSDFDIYLYNPSGLMMHAENYYYDDELIYPIDEPGFWRIRIKIFPGYTDIPDPEDWEYFTYGSGAYKLYFDLVSSAAEPPGPIPQPQITPIAQTFIVSNDPDSNKDEYGYLASIPACNYLEDGVRYLSPIVYTGDNTITNWFGTVDDTTDYLLNDWNTYLIDNGKSAVEYNVPFDPIIASSEIATNCWESSDLAVVVVDGSNFEDITTQVLHETQTLKRTVKTVKIPNNSWKIKNVLGTYVYLILLGSKWGAINVSIYGDYIPGGFVHVYPSLIEFFPKYMVHVSDWWPTDADEPRCDIYYPITSKGIWAASVPGLLGDWHFEITKYGCHRYSIEVDDPDSVLTVDLTTILPSDLLVFLVDPQGHIRAPDVPDWNGGPINPIHEWNGIDDPNYPPSCDAWRSWDVEPHTEFTAEVLHPEKGTWRAIVVPRYATGASNIEYTLSAKIREINPKRSNADISAANGAVIASQEHVPLLYVTEDSVPTETQDAFDALGVNKVIFVQKDSIGSSVEGALPTIVANLKTMQDIVNYIKYYALSKNYITITSLKTGNGYFAPSAMLAAFHCSPVLRIGEAPGNPAGIANKIDTWRLWGGDYYHGNRAPGNLPVYDKPVSKTGNFWLLIELIKYLLTGGKQGDLPPIGRDAKRYWNEEMYNGIYEWINEYGLDLDGPEAFVFVAPRKDIRLEAHSVMMGNNSYAGHIPGDTPSYSNDVIIRNILYPALIYANPNRDVTTTQFINFADSDSWITNDGVNHQVSSSRGIKNAFMSHGRTYDGHCLWDAHLQRLNDGASVLYCSGHGTGGSGISAQYFQTDYSNYPDQTWPDAWRGYMYDNWETPRENGRVWYNPEPPNLYDIIHFKWVDQLLDNFRSNAVFYLSCSTGQQFGPMVYLDHGAVMWYGNAGTGLCPEEDLMDEWFFKEAMIHGIPVGLAYSKFVWLHYRDFTTGDPTAMYGLSSLHGAEGIATVHCIYGDPKLILYSPEWKSPIPGDSVLSN